MKTFKLLVLCSLLSIKFAYAQQDYLLTHYMFNGLALNPAYAGVHDGISTGLLMREQWMGYEGAPSTQLASIHSPIPGRAASIGGLVYRDQIGVSTQYGVSFSYAYRLMVNNQFQLSMGLQASSESYELNLGGLNLSPNDDEGFGRQQQTLLNVGAGLLLHSEKAYLGISIPKMLEPKLMIDDPDGFFMQRARHYYLTAGYVLDLGNDLLFKPNLLVKAVEGAPWQMDINANFLIKSMVWVGASYRSLDSIDALLGLQINANFSVSYATDFSLNDINTPSHEIMINYVFELPSQRILTPRYF